MKCINTHRNWAKLQLMAQSSSLMFPLTTLCWWCGSTPTTSITKLESAKSAVTGAVILSQMQKKCVSPVSHLFYQLAALNFYTALAMTDICKPVRGAHFCWELHDEDNNRKSARQQTEWSASMFYSISVSNFICNSLSVNANYTVK